MMLFIVPLLLSACDKEKISSSSTPVELPTAPSEPSIQPPEPQLRRLSIDQYHNAINDLLGEGLVLPTNLEPDISVEGFISVGSAITSISPVGVERYEAAAFSLASQVLEDENRRDELLTCIPNDPMDSECAMQFIEDFGQRAWRRPLTEEEQNRLSTLITSIGGESGDFYIGVEFGIAALLQSPYFLYRTEHGAEDSGRLNAFELASRLSFLLWNTIPDDPLLQAAKNGSLESPSGLERQVDRMLADPKIYNGVRNIFNEIFRLYELEDLTKDPLIFTHASPDLGPAAKEETLRVIEALLLDKNEDFRTLFTTQNSFVDRRLAALYNIPAPSPEGFGEIYFEDSDHRRGLLGHASFLALQSHSTSSSPTLRGMFIRQTLLCQSIPPPPADVDTSIPEVDASAPTIRERISSHLENPSCNSCHNLTDLIGLGLENFDGIGRWRSHENDALIDPSSDLDGVSFNNAWELAQVIADHPNLGSCFSSHLLRYATGHAINAGETDYHQWLEEIFLYHNWSFIELLRNMAISEGFQQIGVIE